MRPFRRNSYLKGPEATEILRQLSDPRLKDSLDEPHESVDSTEVPSAGSAVTDAQVKVDPDGRVLAVWPRSTEEEETFTRRHLAWATMGLDGTWSSVRYLDTRRDRVFGTSLSLVYVPEQRTASPPVSYFADAAWRSTLRTHGATWSTPALAI